MCAPKTPLFVLAVALLGAVPRLVQADVPLTAAPTAFGPAHLDVVAAGVGLGTQPAALSVTVPAGGSVAAAYLYVTGRGDGDASVLLNGMATSLPLLATSGPLPFDATQSVETRRLAVTLGSGTTAFTIDGYDQSVPGGAFIVAVVNNPVAPLRTVALLEGEDYAFRDFPPPFGPDTETGAFTFAPANADRTARILLFTHDTRADRGDATWLLAAASGTVPKPLRLIGGGGGAQRVQRNRLGVPAASGGLSLGAELDVYDANFLVPAGADYLAFQVESLKELTAPESFALSVAALVLPAANGNGGGGGGSTTTTTLNNSGRSTTTTLNGSSGSTTTTTPNGSGRSTTTTTPNGSGGSTTTTTPNGSGGSTTTTTPNGSGRSTTTTTPNGSSGSTTTTTPNGSGGSTTTTPTSSGSSTSLPGPGGSPPPPNCGDGVVDLDEECDDGNQVGGDGCDAVCEAEDTGETWKLNLRVRKRGIDRLVYFTLLRDLPSALFGTVPVHITLSSREFQMLDAEIPASAFKVRPRPVLAQPDGRFARAVGNFGIWRIKLRLSPVTGIRGYDARLFVRGEMLPEMWAKLYLTTVIRVGNVVYTATDPLRANRTGKYLRYIHPVLDE